MTQVNGIKTIIKTNIKVIHSNQNYFYVIRNVRMILIKVGIMWDETEPREMDKRMTFL